MMLGIALAALSTPAIAPPAPTLSHQSTALAVAKTLEDGYCDPELGARMANVIRQRSAAGDYPKTMEGPAFAAKLQRDIRNVYDDRHLRVEFSAEKLPPMPPLTLEPPKDYAEHIRPWSRHENFGLASVQVLPGNIGAIDFRYFVPLALSGKAIDAAMEMVAHTDALIIDLRQNRGSMDPDTIPYLMGYFFERPVMISELYWRPTNTTRQFWTASQVAGPRYLDKPVTILTSNSTFSGGEALAFDMQALKRAKVYGEPTGGGGNPGGTVRIDDHFALWLPAGKGKSAVTNKTFEGIGVIPDVAVRPADALRKAQFDVLSALSAATQNADDRQRFNAAKQALQETPVHTVRKTVRLEGRADAKKVAVAGSFNYWSKITHPMRREGNAWVGEIEGPPGRHTYKFAVDGELIPDPKAPKAPESPFGDSLLLLP